MPPSRALAEFVAEATEVLEELSRELLVLDEHRGEEPEPDRINAIFRAAHSLKGLAGLFGQTAVSELAHAAEDVLDGLRLGRVPLDDQLLDALIESLDAFQSLLQSAANDETAAAEPAKGRAKAIAERLSSLAAVEVAPATDALDAVGLDPQVRAVLTEYEEHRLRENLRRGVTLLKVRAVFSLDDFDTRLAALNGALKPLGEVVSTLPSSKPGEDATIAFDLLFGASQSLEAVAAAAEPLGATVEPLVSQPEAPLAPVRPLPRPSAPITIEPGGEARAELSSLRSLTQTVRVDIGRLDTLMNAVGELLLTRANIERLAESARAAGTNALPKLWGQQLLRESRTLERKLDELQKGILDVRMVPLGQVFDKLARLMRRLSRESGKQLEFAISGGDVELDKLIVEELSDPLMHLLRNALDHGVELPEQRAKAHKPKKATVRLTARSQGNHVVLEVGDDGAGMDEERIKEVAILRGLVTPQQADALDRRELLNLVFLPGFSTRSQVSDLSGRGVGLDVVKTNLQRLSGIIDVESERGRGTTFRLTLPLTLAIIRALVVQVSGRTYAVPLNSVMEIVSVRPDELRTVERREVFSLRGQTLPFLRLSRLFKLPERPIHRYYVVVVGLAQQRLGLAVDALVGQQDVVTKPLGGRLRDVKGIAGATDLGDRQAVLVLDVGELMEEVVRRQAAG